MRNPWLKFYPLDWRGDPKLRMCSMAARGLWIEILTLMHEASPYGHLLVSGKSPTDAQIAVLAGAPSDQITDLIGELDAAGVFSRTKDGVIYSRRMIRDEKRGVVARKNGGKGGNPKLGKDNEKSVLDNPQDNPEDKPQKPYARNQTKTSSDVFKRASAPKKPGFVHVRKTTDAINDFIQELDHVDDKNRIDDRCEDARGNVQLLSAVGARRS